MSKSQNDEQELTEIEHAFGEAITRLDPAAIEPYLAEDFSAIVDTGEIFDRQKTLAAVASKDYEVVFLRNEDIRVRVYGDAAVVTARGVVQGRYKGQEANGEFRYTRVWIRRNGRWQAVAAQSTSLPRKAPLLDNIFPIELS